MIYALLIFHMTLFEKKLKKNKTSILYDTFNI